MLRGVCGGSEVNQKVRLPVVKKRKGKKKKKARFSPVESVQESQFDGSQVGGIGDDSAVGGILDQVHGTREWSSNFCQKIWDS